MYVVTWNEQVLLGPMAWNSRMFNTVIEDDTEIVTNILPSDVSKVPLDLGNGILIRECVDFHDPLISVKTQMYQGPTWTFSPTLGTAAYHVVDKPIDLVRGELKSVLAAERFRKEELGTSATIQGMTVTVDTARSTRDVFVLQYMLLPDGQTTPWKFPEGWLTMTKTDLGICVQAGVGYVQSQFAWEAGLVAQIENPAATLAMLDALVILPLVVRPGLGV